MAQKNFTGGSVLVNTRLLLKHFVSDLLEMPEQLVKLSNIGLPIHNESSAQGVAKEVTCTWPSPPDLHPKKSFFIFTLDKFFSPLTPADSRNRFAQNYLQSLSDIWEGS